MGIAKKSLPKRLKSTLKRILPTRLKSIIKRVLGLGDILRADRLEHDLLMPKYLFHSPMDYDIESHAPEYGEPVLVDGVDIPVPPPECRPGYSPDDALQYLKTGRADADFIRGIIKQHAESLKNDVEILDWGCSSGRVLRQFYQEHKQLGWRLHGVDIQAFLVEWMRRYFPPAIDVACGSILPHLPFRDSSLDVIYGLSVLTHTKYLWDTWLCEFRRVLKKGGLCILTVQCELAWRTYHQHRDQDWVKAGHPSSMLAKPELDEDFFLYGDGYISQTFFKADVVKKYFGRYMKVVDFLEPTSLGYQNWIVLKNEV